MMKELTKCFSFGIRSQQLSSVTPTGYPFREKKDVRQGVWPKLKGLLDMEFEFGEIDLFRGDVSLTVRGFA